jgi:hypothetical protein
VANVKHGHAVLVHQLKAARGGSARRERVRPRGGSSTCSMFLFSRKTAYSKR